MENRLVGKSAFLFLGYIDMDNSIHIGKAIQAKLKEQGRTVKWMSEKLCYERTNVYSIFRRKSIDTDLLYRISIILEYDFLSCMTAKIANSLGEISVVEHY